MVTAKLSLDLIGHLKQPKSTQQLRDLMDCSSHETEQLLALMRDEGTIAYANGEWYKMRSGRLRRAPRARKEDARQEKLFK